ncbi:hypothetical protein EKL30_03400 [Candidimonas sp. SYP-B2681]|uniref:hypothetical protein n=1 Tax=Candidimonas sp. SYP-B2681 TaxID=2497686 RepID=UPI000F899CBD|nr:hypothetical protein [Candidimonas sp. SYP-B2681]RTZ48030.1 hypothetical protein EKL30_03400 [Candidimonas sp. SYP-B2681]
MPMLGKAAVAMWWNIAPSQRAEFEDWHSHEHFPERMGIPGFLRGSRWASVDGGEGFFVMYELDCYETLTSEGYVQRLNNPTPWSTKMMPQHRDMVRSQCIRVHSSGGGIGQYALTLRFSPAHGREAEVSVYLAEVAESFAKSPGGGAFHVLRTETPQVSATKEQQIRGGKDTVADWIVIAIGYDLETLQTLQHEAFSAPMMEQRGFHPGALSDTYQLAYALTANDLGRTAQ